MKILTSLSTRMMAACFVLAFVFCFSPSQGMPLLSASVETMIMEASLGQITQGWTRDAALHVTATTSPADTDLRGTITTGWDKIVVHNKDSTIWAGVHALIAGRTGEAAGINTFIEMTLFVPPMSTLTITNENVIILRHITESSTVDLIIERHEKI